MDLTWTFPIYLFVKNDLFVLCSNSTYLTWCYQNTAPRTDWVFCQQHKLPQTHCLIYLPHFCTIKYSQLYFLCVRDVLCEDRFFREIFWVSEVRSLLLKVLVTWPGRCGWLAGRRCSRKAGSGERVAPDDRCHVLYTPTSFQPQAGSGYGEQKSNSSKTSRCLRWINGGHQQVWLNNLSLFTPSLFHAYYELELCCTNSSVTVDLCSFLHKGQTLFYVHM